MNELESKLKAFRREERKKQIVKKCKTYITQPFTKVSAYFSDDCEELLKEAIDYETAIETSPSIGEEIATDDANDEPDEEINWKRLLFNVSLWCCLFKVAVYVEFGAVFFILSCFYIIWTNTRTSPRKPNEISAYSVFNPNCEPIMGTYDAEKLEAEMRYGLMI